MNSNQGPGWGWCQTMSIVKTWCGLNFAFLASGTAPMNHVL